MDDLPKTLFKFQYPNQNSIWSLAKKYFYFAKIEQLNDPFEFKYSIDYGDSSIKAFLLSLHKSKIIDNEVAVGNYIAFNSNSEAKEKIIRDMQRYPIEAIAVAGGVFSTTSSEINPTQWAHYSENHKGWAIEFDPLTLFEDVKASHWQSVEYVEELPCINYEKINFSNSTKRLDLIELIIASKSKDWEYESEFRMIKGFDEGKHFEPKVTFNTSSIKSIIFGKDTHDNNIDLVQELTKNWGCNYRIASPSDKKYEMVIKDL